MTLNGEQLAVFAVGSASFPAGDVANSILNQEFPYNGAAVGSSNLYGLLSASALANAANVVWQAGLSALATEAWNSVSGTTGGTAAAVLAGWTTGEIIAYLGYNGAGYGTAMSGTASYNEDVATALWNLLNA